jgi:cellulase/cellobiase CelA1
MPIESGSAGAPILRGVANENTGGDPGGTTNGGTNEGTTNGGTHEGTCTASHRSANTSGDGFQGGVTVRNDGTSTLNGWTVAMTLAPGQSIGSLWNGQHTGTSGTITVRNAAWNGTIAPNAATAFGFVATGNPATQPTDITCTAS